MIKAFGEYRRLARGIFGCSSLWAGTGHLLYVKGSGFLVPLTEEYRRVRYSEIQALSMVPTVTSLVMSILYALGLLVFLVPCVILIGLIMRDNFFDSAARSFTVVGIVLCGPVALAFLVALMVNLVRGKSCIFAVQTATSTLRLRPAGRVKIARRITRELAREIREHQPEVAGSPPPTGGSRSSSEELRGIS